MNITTAREIITQARNDETYAGPVPEDDATCLKEAENLVTMAEQAWAQHIRGPEVEAILRLAAGGENGDQPESASEPETASTSSDDENEQAPEIDISTLPENLTKVEPWEGYGEDRVKDITDGVNVFVEENPDDLVDILRHVRAYESSHKRRVRILKHLDEIFKKLGVENESQVQAESTEQSSSGPESREQVSGPAEGERTSDAPIREEASEKREGDTDNGSAEGPSSTSETAPESSDAAIESVGETRPEGGEGESREAEPTGQDQGERSDQRGDGDSSETSAYQKLLNRVEQELRAERLDIPHPPSEVVPELPWRWNEISDSDLRDYHMQFASLAYYKSYVYSRDERIAMLCKEAADELRNALMVSVEKYDDHNKEKKVGLIEAEIESDDAVRRWRRLQRKHEAYAQAAKREMESYYKLVESLSRLESMRHNAWERARR